MFTFLFILFTLILWIGVPVTLFLVIRYFIRFSATQNKKTTQQQEEIKRMNIKDL